MQEDYSHTMEVNDTTDYQRCFACGQRNEHGLHMVFRQEENTVVCDIQPHAEHQGFPGIIHGGIIATMLDEAMNRTSLFMQDPTWMMTGRMEVRYRRYVPYGPLLRVRAWLGSQRRRLIEAHGKVTLAEDETVVFAESTGTFLSLTPAMLDEMMKEYPGMRNFFANEETR